MKEKILKPENTLMLDGQIFKLSLLSVLNIIHRKKSYLNRINVFPIPDKDTGSNLFHTLHHICSDIKETPIDSIGKIGKRISKSAAVGAQGYSGIILAHFFQGFFQAVTKKEINTIEFARATDLAGKSAFQSISDPKNGTMISVMQDWSNSISEISRQTNDFKVLFTRSLPVAKKSLAKTKKILPELKKAGVVDAGAQGFIYLIEGMLRFFSRGLSKKEFSSGDLKYEIKKSITDKPSKKPESSAPTKSIGIVTDSSCDLPNGFIQAHHIHLIPLKIIFGNETFLDKIQMSPSEFYQRLVQSPHHPQTSQPALADITRVFNVVVPKYDHILSIHLPRAVSGTLSAIESAAQNYGEKIICIDSNNISAALGLIIMDAVDAISRGLSIKELVCQIEKSIENTRIFIILATVKYLVKGGRLSKPKGLIGRLLRLNPIVTIDPQGHLTPLSKAFGNKAALKKALKIAHGLAQEYKQVRFIIAHANAAVKARWIASQISGLFPHQDQIQIVEAAPVLGVHAGPGTVGFAFIGSNES
jgi:DegV family protein with EDD domain